VGAVLFDLDGTLFDHVSAAASAVTAWTSSVAPACDRSESWLCERWAALEAEHYGDYLTGRCTFTEQRRRRVLAFLTDVGVDPRTDDADRLFEGYLDLYEQAWRPFPDVLPVLSTLRALGLVVAVLTNGDEEQQRAKVAAIGVSDLVTDVIASSAIGVAKPHPVAFLTACQHLSLDPATTVYVGDNLQSDALAADAAGLQGVWLNRTDSPHDPTVARAARSLSEVADLLTTIPA
jgi:putative hydrolase of the HAD superfamily